METMFRLDYLSCLLTVLSTVMVGRRLWQGWVVAGANSAVICYIGLRTAQTGFIPANLFCIAMYVYNIVQWRKPGASERPLVSLSQGFAAVSIDTALRDFTTANRKSGREGNVISCHSFLRVPASSR